MGAILEGERQTLHSNISERVKNVAGRLIMQRLARNTSSTIITKGGEVGHSDDEAVPASESGTVETRNWGVWALQ